MALVIYRERVVVWWLSAIMGFIAAIMLALLVYQVTIGPFEDIPDLGLILSLLYLFMFILFLFLTLNFSALSITVDEGELWVSFGISRKRYPFSGITGVRRDTTSAISYGGFGIRMVRIEGRSRLAYTVPRVPRIVISLEGFRFDEFVLSTRNPEDLMAIIKTQMGLS